MNLFHCPHMDRLGHELIETYRTIPDKRASDGGASVHRKISDIHLKMADHRKHCAICHQIQRHSNEKTDSPVMIGSKLDKPLDLFSIAGSAN